MFKPKLSHHVSSRCRCIPKCEWSVDFVDRISDDVEFSLCEKEARTFANGTLKELRPKAKAEHDDNVQCRSLLSTKEKQFISKHYPMMTYKEIAAALGRHYETIGKYVRERRRGYVKKADRNPS